MGLLSPIDIMRLLLGPPTSHLSEDEDEEEGKPEEDQPEERKPCNYCGKIHTLKF
jgi:hypothetical protein